MWWAIGWKYKQAIIITNASERPLLDYQVKVDFNSDNFDFAKANSDGSDIRFTYNNERVILPYWIEKWDVINQLATVWVKVPYVPANKSVVMYVYYGNDNAVSKSDPKAVFDFYDDFNDLNKWELVHGSPSGFIQDSWLVLENTSQTLYGVQMIVPQRIIIETYAYDEVLNDDADVRVGIYDLESGETWVALLNRSKIYLEIVRVPMGVLTFDWYESVEFSSVPPVTGILSFVRDGNTFYAKWNGDDGQGVETPAHIETEYDVNEIIDGIVIGIDSGDVDNIKYDWVRVRKYANPEPSLTFMKADDLTELQGIVYDKNMCPITGKPIRVFLFDEDTGELLTTTISNSGDGSWSLRGDFKPNTKILAVFTLEDAYDDIDIAGANLLTVRQQG